MNIDIVKEAKLLGVILTDKLIWDKNTNELVRKAFMRMKLLNTAAGFTKSKQDLKSIYLTFIRSVLEQSAVVWHSSLVKRNINDLERVQKAAVRVIMGRQFTNYKKSLQELNLETLEKRRETLCLKFAKNCLKNEKLKDMFPLKKRKHKMKKRNENKYEMKKNRTKRLKMSALPYMRKLLNDENLRKTKFMKNQSC